MCVHLSVTERKTNLFNVFEEAEIVTAVLEEGQLKVTVEIRAVCKHRAQHWYLYLPTTLVGQSIPGAATHCNQNTSVSKCMFLYSAISSPLDHSKRFTLFLPWQTCSFRYQLGFSGKHSSQAAITCNDYSLTFPPMSIARYSCLQLSELGCHVGNENGQTSKR